MLSRALKGSFYHRRKAVALILISVIMGSSIASGLIALTLELSKKIAREMRSFGANIVVEPREESKYLNEGDLAKIKTIFWRHNIIGFAPYLYGVVQVYSPKTTQSDRVVLAGTWFKHKLRVADKTFVTGTEKVIPWWLLQGRLLKAEEKEEILLGTTVAKKLGIKTGDLVKLSYQSKNKKVKVVGIVETGGVEDGQIFAPLALAQNIFNLPGKVSKVLVSAETVPLDAFGRKDPQKMSRREFEKWYCTAYVTSIAKQISEVIKASRVTPIWQIAEAEGKIMSKLSLIMIILAGITIIGAAVSVSTTMTTTILERRGEIGLMKAIGADSRQIFYLIVAEVITIGVIGSLFGFLVGLFLIRILGIVVFGSPVETKFLLLPLTIASALLVTLLGSLLPAKKAVDIETTTALRSWV
jgi:putative ABC transport system permease protein